MCARSGEHAWSHSEGKKVHDPCPAAVQLQCSYSSSSIDAHCDSCRLLQCRGLECSFSTQKYVDSVNTLTNYFYLNLVTILNFS